MPVDTIISSGVTLSSAAQLTPGAIPGGTRFNSYLLQFDPVGQNGTTLQLATGSITFAGEILGLLLNDNSLASTDSLLASIGNYGQLSDRGLSLGTQGSLGSAPAVTN